jgi:hypothetical protein
MASFKLELGLVRWFTLSPRVDEEHMHHPKSGLIHAQRLDYNRN